MFIAPSSVPSSLFSTSSSRQTAPESLIEPGSVGLGQDYYDEEGDALKREQFYSPIQDTFEKGQGDEIFLELNKHLKKNHRPQKYKPREHLYPVVDRRPDGGLYYLYSGEGPKNEEDYEGPATRELTNYNAEHVVPQSWFQKKEPMRGDLHHLFTEEIQCNAIRSNYPLEPLEDGTGVPSCGMVDEQRRIFEPHAGKGETARAVLYFVTRYPGQVGDRDTEMTVDHLPQLLEWHREYPVSDYERHRNASIEKIQGVRNPFIDHPELADKVDFRLGFGPVNNPHTFTHKSRT